MPTVHWKNDDNLNGRVALASCGVVAKKNLNFTDADAGVVALIVVTCRSCLRCSSRFQSAEEVFAQVADFFCLLQLVKLLMLLQFAP